MKDPDPHTDRKVTFGAAGPSGVIKIQNKGQYTCGLILASQAREGQKGASILPQTCNGQAHIPARPVPTYPQHRTASQALQCCLGSGLPGLEADTDPQHRTASQALHYHWCPSQDDQSGAPLQLVPITRRPVRRSITIALNCTLDEGS